MAQPSPAGTPVARLHPARPAL